MAYGKRTANLMDIPLKKSSVFTPYVGDNGYRFEGANTIYVLSNDNGSLVTYDEASATAPFGAVTLATPVEQTLTLAYNQAMIKRIQHTQMQDIPVDDYARKYAVQQVDQVFIPAHDEYSLGKLQAARPVGNVITVVGADLVTTENVSLKFEQALNKARSTGNAEAASSIAWMSYEFAAALSAKINFTGSSEGYTDARKGYLGRHKGVTIVETPDDYFAVGTYVIIADKRAIVAVKPKMDPQSNGYELIKKVPGFSGVELQLRDRGDTFVLNRKKDAIATIEEA